MDLLTNATVVEDAIRFVSSNRNKDDNSDNEEQKHISNHQAKEEESTMAATIEETTTNVISLVYLRETDNTSLSMTMRK